MPRLVTAAALLAFLIPTSGLAHDGVLISDARARIAPGAKSGAIFMIIENHETGNDKLMSIQTDAAELTEVHQTRIDASGMASMPKVVGGLIIPAETEVRLEPGGTHIMIMGLTRKLVPGDTVTLKLMFDYAGEVVVEVPIVPAN